MLRMPRRKSAKDAASPHMPPPMTMTSATTPSGCEVGLVARHDRQLAFRGLGPQFIQTMSDHDAEHRIAEELEALVRFETAAWPLVHVRRVDERCLEQQRVAERVTKRLGEIGRHG